MRIRITGRSDDTVCVDHEDPNRGQELDLSSGGVAFLHFPETDDVFRVEYGSDGIWHIDHHVVGSAQNVERTPCPPGDMDEVYTDEVTMDIDVPIAHLWTSWPIDDHEVVDKLEDEDVVEHLLPEERMAILNRIWRKVFDREYQR